MKAIKIEYIISHLKLIQIFAEEKKCLLRDTVGIYLMLSFLVRLVCTGPKTFWVIFVSNMVEVRIEFSTPRNIIF